jgi:selenocysteine lyase/cysteine desulfurase
LSIDIARLRKRFPALAHKHYLNSGSYGLLSVDVKRAFEEYLACRDERGSDWGEWAMRDDAVRTRVAQLLNASADEIAITTSASAGINSLVTALDFSGPRNKVVVSDFEFPTSGQIWHAQERRGVRIEHVPEAENGYIPLEHFERAIDEKTRVVAIAQVCYRNGARLDVGEIVRIAHRKGALVMLDCFQAVGAVGIDVKALDVDFAAGGMLKYLLGTAGIGFLYCRRELIEALVPTVTGWFAQANQQDMDIYHNRPAPNARRFQAGTPPVPNCYAAAAGLDIILELGIGEIERRIRALTGTAMDRLLEVGATFATPRDDARRGPSVCIRANDDNALVAKLAERNIVTSCRAGNVRATFHCYNDETDIEALVSAVTVNRHLLRRD